VIFSWNLHVINVSKGSSAGKRIWVFIRGKKKKEISAEIDFMYEMFVVKAVK
jgi:hypothetical protein